MQRVLFLPRALLISISSSVYCDLAAFIVADMLPLIDEPGRSAVVDVIYTSRANRLTDRQTDSANYRQPHVPHTSLD